MEINPPSPGSPRRFFVADFNAQGEQKLKAEYRYAELEQVPAAAEFIVHLATLLYRSPEGFETILPGAATTEFRWRASAPTAGIATLRCRGNLASLSLYASGLDEQADYHTLRAFQQHMLHELHDTGFEPAFDLMNISERPLMATINFADPQDSADRMAVALADRCFAAAYFRYLSLA